MTSSANDRSEGLDKPSRKTESTTGRKSGHESEGEATSPLSPAPGPHDQQFMSDRNDDHDFAPFRAIPLMRFKEQLFNDLRLEPQPCRITRRTEGSYHHVVLLQLDPQKQGDEYVIKLPKTGVPEQWCEQYAYTMRSEADLMEHISWNTRAPVPKVFTCDDTPNNKLGFPYMLMSKLPGKSAYHIWLDDDDIYHEHGDGPSPETLKRRVTFLNSLAQCMAGFQKIQSDKIGTLRLKEGDPNDPIFTHTWMKDLDDGSWQKREAVSSSKEFFLSGLERDWPASASLDSLLNETDDEETKEQWTKKHYESTGMRRIMEIYFLSAPFTPKRSSSDNKESFVLRHWDLDLQNILTDEDGNVTGILDWDRASIVPRCVGYASPFFPTKQWLPGFSLDDPPHMLLTVDHYRQIYTNAMKAACPEGRFTSKSVIYQAAFATMIGCGPCPDLVAKMLKAFPALQRVDLEEFQEKVGRGWEIGEKWLEVQIAEFLEPDAQGIALEIGATFIGTITYQS